MNPRHAVLLDGERPGESLLESARGALESGLAARGWVVRAFRLREIAVASCTGCFGCWIKTPGECVQADDAREIARAVIGARLLAVLTPVTFGGYSSTAKRAIERLMPLLSPLFETIGGEVHHRRRYPRFPDLLAVGVQDRSDPEAADLFRALVARNAINVHSRVHRVFLVPAGAGTDAVRAELNLHLDALEERP